jgi:hypothetical protein
MKQELVYAERALIRVGNVEYRADASIVDKIGYSEEKLKAHWMRYLGKGSEMFGEKTNISDLLRHTSTAGTSDMRDKLFSIISLVNQEHLRIAFPPDYTISRLHFCIGTLAHMFLEEGHTSFLYRARKSTGAESSTDPQLPSWFPSPLDIDERFRGESNEDIPYGLRNPWPARLFPNRSEPLYLQDEYVHGHYNIREKLPWHRNARVSTQTGFITFTLTYLFTFEKKPFLRGDWQNYHIFHVNPEPGSNGNRGQLGLVSQDRLDTIIIPGQDHLFLLSPTRAESKTRFNKSIPMYLLLRGVRPETIWSNRAEQYRLLASDAFLFLDLDEPKTTSSTAAKSKSTGEALKIKYVRYTVADCIKKIHDRMRGVYISNHDWARNSYLADHPYFVSSTVLFPKHFLHIQWQQLFPGKFAGLEPLNMYLNLIREVYSQIETVDVQDMSCWLEESVWRCDSTEAPFVQANGPQPPPVLEDVSGAVEVDKVLRWLSGTYLTFNEEYHATIDEGFITMQFRKTEWDERIREFYIYFNVDYLEPDWSRWLPHQYTGLGWEWKTEDTTLWRSLTPDDYETMREIIPKRERGTRTPFFGSKLPRPKPPLHIFGDIALENSGQYIHVRAPVGKVSDFLVRNLTPVIASLSLLIAARHSKLLDLETMLKNRLVCLPSGADNASLKKMLDRALRRPTKCEKIIGISKMLGDVQIRGSPWPVEII